MAYFDTSFLAPLVINEDSSEALEAYVLALPPEELVTSAWTQVELASLVSRRERMGEFTRALADRVRAQFARLLSEHFEVLTPTRMDFESAAGFLRNAKSGLRAGDTLHLAVAHNQGGLEILSLDQGLIRGARQLGMKATKGIRARSPAR